MGSRLKEYLNVPKEQVDDLNICGTVNDIPEDGAGPEPENGAIGLTLAHRVGMVIGIEMNAAVSDAHKNAENNGIIKKNCRFICSKAEQVMGSRLKEYLNVPKEQVDDLNICGTVNDIPEDGAGPEPENGKQASLCSENNNSEVKLRVRRKALLKLGILPRTI
ncbi:hypothetical protein RYX36_001835 [Vicia faba]